MLGVRVGGDGTSEMVPASLQEYDGDVALESLQAFPGNPKDHDLGAIMESIKANGMADVIKVQRSTRRILGGHGTREALLALGYERGPVLWLDVDDRTARRLVLAYNRATELGGFHQGALLDFLREDALAGNLEGTGYVGSDVDDLASYIEGPSFDETRASAGVTSDSDFWPMVKARLDPLLYARMLAVGSRIDAHANADDLVRLLTAIVTYAEQALAVAATGDVGHALDPIAETGESAPLAL